MVGGRWWLGGQPLQQAGFDAVELLGADDAFVPELDELLQFLPEALRRQPGVGGGGLGLEVEGPARARGWGRPAGRLAWVRLWAPL